MSYIDIVDHFKNTADIHHTLLGKCIASGRLNLGRAFALSGNLISEVKWRAYPARSKSLISYDEKTSEIMDSMTVAQLLQWYDEHGKHVLNVISCAHLFKAIDPFRAIDDGERVNQGAAIVARMRDLAEQEQHPLIRQRLIDIASQFEQQVPQPLPALPVWLHGLADQLLQDNQALSEWRHPYPLPASQPALLNNLPGFLHLLADSLHVRTLREFFQLLANDFPPPVETLRELEESVIENIPNELQQRLLSSVRLAYNDTHAQNTFDRRSTLIRRAYQVLQPIPHPMEWLCQFAVLMYQLSQARGGGAAQQEHTTHFQEWLSLLREQLQFANGPYPTAFLRDMARRRLQRLEPFRQLIEFLPDAVQYLGAQYLELVPLLERAREESALLMDPFWNNETKWLGHIIADL
jgi:hypothetical protein